MSQQRPGRRIAAPDRAPRRRLDAGAALAGVLVLLAAVATVLVAPRSEPARPEVDAGGVLVDHAVRGCAAFQPPAGVRSEAVVGAVPVAELDGSGTLRAGAPGELSPRGTLSRGELLGIRADRTAPESLAVTTDGELAPGLVAVQSAEGRGGTLSVAECPAPQAHWWFTGAGATLDHDSQLVLANLDSGPAVVDVRVLGAQGPVDTVGTRGITVPPGERTSLRLTDIAPQGEELAVEVAASQGRVVAAMTDSFAPEFGAATGLDQIPGQDRASRLLRLPGLPARADAHQLVVANPTDREALVEIQVSGRTGTFTPTDDDQVRVPPGSVVSTDLTQTVGRRAASIILRSPVPVTATVRSQVDGDTSYAAPERLLSGPGAALIPEGGAATVALSAGSEAASARITVYDANGEQLRETTLDVPAGATSTAPVPRRAATLVVTPEEGRVVGAVTFGGDGASWLGLHDLQLRVERPVVLPAFD